MATPPQESSLLTPIWSKVKVRVKKPVSLMGYVIGL